MAEEGDTHREIVVDKIEAKQVEDVADMREVIYNISRNKLPGKFAVIDLHVYPPSTTNFKQEPWRLDKKIVDLPPRTLDNPIIVVATPPPTSASTTTSSELAFEPSQWESFIVQRSQQAQKAQKTQKTQISLQIRWTVRDDGTKVYVPFTVTDVPLDGTIGALKQLFLESLNKLPDAGVAWWHGRQVNVYVEKELIEDDMISLKDVLGKRRSIVMDLDSTLPSTPDATTFTTQFGSKA